MSEHHSTLAPSSFPALQHCAHYRNLPKDTPENMRGERIHLCTAEMLRKTLAHEEIETCWLKEEDELEACSWLFRKTQEELREIHGIEEKVEVTDPLTGQALTFGRLDCHGISAQSGLPGLVDWKSGRYGEYWPQMAIYALALMDRLGANEVAVSILYCDSKEIQRYTITLHEAEALLSSTLAAQQDPESPYCTGVYCSHCALRDTCPAWLEPSTTALVAIGSDLAIERGLEHVKSDPVILGKISTRLAQAPQDGRARGPDEAGHRIR